MGCAGLENMRRKRRRAGAGNKKGSRRRHRDPGKCLVGMSGFEPPASASRTQRSSQTEPHPDDWKTALLHNRPGVGKQFRCGCLSGPSPVKSCNSAMQRPCGRFFRKAQAGYPERTVRPARPGQGPDHGAPGSFRDVLPPPRPPVSETRQGAFGDTRRRGR